MMNQLWFMVIMKGTMTINLPRDVSCTFRLCVRGMETFNLIVMKFTYQCILWWQKFIRISLFL